MQTESKDQSILVIPLSTKYVGTTDYRIPITKEKYETFSYARIDRIYPVYPEQLNEYICTLSDDYMKLIEAETIRLLCPTVYTNTEVAKILIEQDLPLDRVSEDAWYDEENVNMNLSNIIGKFIKECVFTSARDSVYATTLYNAYSVWCYKKGNDYIPPEKKNLFCDLFCIMMHLDKQQNYDNYLIKNIRIDNIDFEDGPIEKQPIGISKKDELKKDAIVVSNREPDNRAKDSNKKNHWTEKKKRAFMAFVETHTAAEAASKYEISINSVYKYKKAFQPIIDDDEIVLLDADQIVDNTAVMDVVKNTLSAVSNFIKEDVDTNDAYRYLKTEGTGKDVNIGKKEFYKMISASVYYSLMQFLEITEDYTTKALVSPTPGTLVESRNYLSIANLYLMIKQLMTPYEIRNTIKRDNGGISRNWINYLTNQLSNRLPLSHTGIQSIVDMIVNNYCESKEAPPLIRKIA